MPREQSNQKGILFNCQFFIIPLIVGPTKDSPTPDNDLFKDLALEYAKNHPVMTNDPNCGGFGGQTFKKGVTNGAKWYVSQSSSAVC